MTKFSICIATHRMDRRFMNTLSMLENLKYPKDHIEVCVFANGEFEWKNKSLFSFLADKFEYIDQSIGPSKAKNNAISMASNEWCVLLDSDDFLTPSALTVYDKIVSENPELQVGFELSAINLLPQPKFHFSYPPNEAEFEKFYFGEIGKFGISGACGHPLLFRKSYALRFDPKFPIFEERDLAVRMLGRGDTISVLKTCTYVYNWNPNGITGGVSLISPTKDQLVFKKDILQRLEGKRPKVQVIDPKFALQKEDATFIERTYNLERLLRG